MWQFSFSFLHQRYSECGWMQTCFRSHPFDEEFFSPLHMYMTVCIAILVEVNSHSFSGARTPSGCLPPLGMWAFGIPRRNMDCFLPRRQMLLRLFGSIDCCTLPTAVCVLRSPYTSMSVVRALCTCPYTGKGLLRLERPTKRHMASRWHEEHCWV